MHGGPSCPPQLTVSFCLHLSWCGPTGEGRGGAGGRGPSRAVSVTGKKGEVLCAQSGTENKTVMNVGWGGAVVFFSLQTLCRLSRVFGRWEGGKLPTELFLDEINI